VTVCGGLKCRSEKNTSQATESVVVQYYCANLLSIIIVTYDPKDFTRM